ncbi:MAG: hypothetical protein HKL85_13100 [Acidimicrobiaceae bacterium]|nr:hypothetical protein [Acidimicrobiaceae bacterium]
MSDTRRRRRDAGSVRYGRRDLVGMSWCADQGAMRIDQLARLFSQIDERPVSVDAARKSVGRWLDRGWATSRTLLHGQPPFVWLTPAGMRVSGMSFPSEEPALATLAHNADVIAIRLAIQTAYPNGIQWRSEREIRSVVPPRARGKNSPHLPDGEVIFPDGQIVAIERERVAKTIERTRNIQMGLLTRRYDYDATSDVIVASLPPRYCSVHYYASDEALSVVQKAGDSLPGDLGSRLQIVRWP